MSDLGGGGPSAPAGNGRSNNGGMLRQAAAGATGSPNIRGPREVMRERQAREARKKAEQEQQDLMERQRAEDEAHQIEESNRRSAERRAAVGAAAQQRVEGGQRGSGGTTGQRISDNSQRSQRSQLHGVGTGGPALGGGEAAISRPRPSQSSQTPRPVQDESSRVRQTPTQAGPSNARPLDQQPQPQESRTPVARSSSFPHAFERWENLSSHWEGLTSYWLRKINENSVEIEGDALLQQLSRQVTDLSGAGANLFHAVVELQRLRASSERKFQRWFFETRAEQERAQEIQAQLEQALEHERNGRAAAIAEAVVSATGKERENSHLDKQLQEMKRELQISKDEARRAWDELGRRENEERERTLSLKEGQPTIVGGVQVVPMMQGVPSRHGSTRDVPPTRDGGYGGASGSVQEVDGPADSDAAYQEYSRTQRADPTDPFVDDKSGPTTYGISGAGTSRTTGDTRQQHPGTYDQAYSQAPPVQPTTSSAFYQQGQGISLHPTERDHSTRAPSEGAFSEEEYAIDQEGQFILDERGNRKPYRAPQPPSDDESDEYDVDEYRERQQADMQRYGTGAEHKQGATATTGAGRGSSSQPASSLPGADYTGEGYGSGSGSGSGYGSGALQEWDSVPRHHHPTRLSDVLEEDERSRTSASQVSRRE